MQSVCEKKSRAGRAPNFDEPSRPIKRRLENKFSYAKNFAKNIFTKKIAKKSK
ncbi:MAG: hypothetical protein FWD19_06360 [Defluviitaleaceae bacterium]|nr:hypothetical protein [Defluviitaleaceae bacterium]